MATTPQGTRLSRRRLLGTSLALGLGGLLLKSGLDQRRAAAAVGLRHLVWVWQFATDGEPNLVGSRLQGLGLGILLKTHDGLQWMSEYDKSPYAVTGPAQVAVLANYFESAGVPFHAWAVVQGVDPVREARMAAEVLAAGARSIFLDLEPHPGFWRGTPADAVAFGQELRRLQPDAQVVLSVDPRPWTFERIPIAEFAAFASAIAPQQYWQTFNTPANHTRYAESGFPVPPTGLTPEFLLDVSVKALSAYGRPIIHVGQGATADAAEWRRFVEGAYGAGSDFVTVWRYGVTTDAVFSLLVEIPPRQPQVTVYVVEPGDTLSAIAARFGTTVEAIVEANNIADAHWIYVGQQLQIAGPGGIPAPTAPAAASVSAPVTSSGRTYTVQAGDTLYGIAGRFGTTVDSLVQLNGIADAHWIYVDQMLQLP